MRDITKNCNFAPEFKIIAMEFTGKIIAYPPREAEVQKLAATSGNHKSTLSKTTTNIRARCASTYLAQTKLSSSTFKWAKN